LLYSGARAAWLADPGDYAALRHTVRYGLALLGPSFSAPTVGEAWLAIRDCLGKREAAKGRVRWLRSARGSMMDPGPLLRFWLDFHSGRTGGSLWGPMMRGCSGASDRMETLATLIRVSAGAKSSGGLEPWIRAGLISRNSEDHRCN
jgi:hypothetical protein